MRLSDLPQDYERVEEFSDATPNGWRSRKYRFADGSVRTFERQGVSPWRETTPKSERVDLMPLFIEPSAQPDVNA